MFIESLDTSHANLDQSYQSLYSNKVCILHVPSVILAIATNFANVGIGSGDI